MSNIELTVTEDSPIELSVLSDTPVLLGVQEQINATYNGLSPDAKEALLQMLEDMAFVDENGQALYDALYAALYPPANLVSISAVYTQSGDVYPSTSLDSLKTDLVVTAHYDDSSTETVTTYTLSGTLEVGTSTVTVSYGGKSTTFNVTVSESALAVFVNKGSCAKRTSQQTNPYYIYANPTETTARARMDEPIQNDSYVFTVTDGTKYALAAYDPTTNVPEEKDMGAVGTVPAYSGGTKAISYKTVDGAPTSYVWLVLKKNDGTDFTDAELANGAEEVISYESVTPDNVGYERYPWARVGGTIAQKEWVYKNGTTAARARSSKIVINKGYTFTVTDSNKYSIVVYNVTNIERGTITSGSLSGTDAWEGTDNSKSWAASGSSSSPFIALSFKKNDNTEFTDEELANMCGTVFTYS